MRERDGMSQTPTRNLDAEQAVLGSVLMDNAMLARIQEYLTAGDFAHPPHAEIFTAMADLDGRAEKIDHITLSTELLTRGKLAFVGGASYFSQLDSKVAYPQNAVEHARIVRDTAVRRKLAQVGRDIVSDASTEQGELADIIDRAERRVFEISEQRDKGELTPLSAVMKSTLDVIQRVFDSKSGITGLSTGFIDLDKELAGLHKGELIILAARPGVGKTALALNIALHAAREGTAVGVFSLEMPANQLVIRLLGSHAEVDMTRVRGGRLDQANYTKLIDAAYELGNLPLYIDDSGGLSAFELRAKARRLKAQDRKLGLLVVDYLQLMHQPGKVENRQVEVAEISRSLKQLAKELNIPILALSQLNRRVDERRQGGPQLSDLRESGAIEQDADVVLFIHRKNTDEGGAASPGPGSDRVECDLIIAKQRNGPVGSVPLLFITKYTYFRSETFAYSQD